MCNQPLTDTDTGAFASAAPRIIRNFGTLPEESLAALRTALGLQMHHHTLAACAAYYRTAHRDPTVDELQLLDTCITACERAHIADSALTSFTSSRQDIAESLSALIQTSKGIRGKSPLPTLRRAFATGVHTAPLDNAHTGGTVSLMTDTAFGALATRGLRPVRSLCIGDSGLRMVLGVPIDAYPVYAPVAGDMISFLTLPRKDETTFARLQHFLEEKETRGMIRAVLPLETGCLFPSLLRIGMGCYADLSVIAPDGASEIPDGYLVVASEAQTHTLLPHARARNFNILAFARLTSDNRLTLAEHDAVKLTIPMQVISSLCRPRALSLQLNPNPHPTVPTCDQASRQVAANGWEAAIDCPIGDPVVLGNTVIVHTTLPFTDDLSPADIQSAIMQAALRLISAGGDLETIEATAALSISPTDSPCAHWSSALGWHRTIRALKLSAQAPVIVSAPSQRQGRFNVCLSARVRQIPENADHAPTCLRLFAVATDATGLPNATEFRAMLSFTSRALADGHIAGLRPLWARPLGEALATVKDLTLLPAFHNATESNTPVFGLLVRSNEELTHGVAVGSLAPEPIADQTDHAEQASDSTGVLTPPRYSPIHRPTPVILLPLLPSVDEPRGLIAYLRRQEADVRTLPMELSHESCTALADAVFEADVLILNGTTDEIGTLLRHRRVRYALEQHMHAYASLIAIRGAAVAIEQYRQTENTATEANTADLDLRLSLLPDGLERAHIERILNYYR